VTDLANRRQARGQGDSPDASVGLLTQYATPISSLSADVAIARRHAGGGVTRLRRRTMPEVTTLIAALAWIVGDLIIKLK
jgi:hypothetical protein